MIGAKRCMVAKAVRELASQGALKRQQGNGTFVAGGVIQRRVTGTRTIGLILPLIIQGETGELIGKITPVRQAQPFTRTNITIEIARGISSVFQEWGYRLVVHSNHTSADQSSVLDNLANESFDGVIAMPNGYEESARRFAELKRVGMPIVFVDRYFRNVEIDSVVSDNFGGAMEGVRYLISRGHHRIAYFTDFAEATSVEDREAGYRAALEEAGIEYDEEIICGPSVVRRGNYSFAHALEHCLGSSEPVTAVFGMNDDMVLGAVQAAGKLGISIPESLEVAGFFDTPIPLGVEVSFTRLVQDKFKIGQLAARLLLERMRGEGTPEPRHTLVPVEMITGESNLPSRTNA